MSTDTSPPVEARRGKLRSIDGARRGKRADQGGDPQWFALLALTARGEVRSTVGNAIILLTRDPAWQGVFAFDERAETEVLLREPPTLPELRAPGDAFPRAVTDADVVRVAAWAERTYRVTIGSTLWHEAIAVVARQAPFDPFRDYLEGLRWDGVARLDAWLVEHLGAEDTPLVRAMASKWLVSAVARTYDPGCQVDHMLVLEGAQGMRKTSALLALFGAAFYADDPPDLSANGGKEAADYLRGRVLVCFDELDGLKRSEVEQIKTYLTRRTDRFRPAYGRRVITSPRRCVFAGTTNGREYLRDATGGRRFWPVACGVGWEPRRSIDAVALGAVRDQLWAEAVVRYRAGATWHLDDDLEAAARDEQEGRRSEDPWEEPVAEYVAGRAEVTTTEVLREVFGFGRPIHEFSREAGVLVDTGRCTPFATRTDQMRAATVLGALGWRKGARKRVNGVRVYPWTAPMATEDVEA